MIPNVSNIVRTQFNPDIWSLLVDNFQATQSRVMYVSADRCVETFFTLKLQVFFQINLHVYVSALLMVWFRSGTDRSRLAYLETVQTSHHKYRLYFPEPILFSHKRGLINIPTPTLGFPVVSRLETSKRSLEQWSLAWLSRYCRSRLSLLHQYPHLFAHYASIF